jgi:hypothetical protein
MTEPSFWKLESSPVLQDAADTTFWIEQPVLPGVRCGACAKCWGLAGRIALDLDAKAQAVLKRNRGPVTEAEFRRQRDLLASGDGVLLELLEPGVQLGRAVVKKFKGPHSGRAYWFAHQFFVPVASINRGSRVSSWSLCSVPCVPPFDWLAEIVPHTLPRRRIYPKVLCTECGSVDRSSLDEAEYRAHIAQMIQSCGLIRVPGATLASSTARKEFEELGVSGIDFQSIGFDQLLQSAR